MKWGRALAAWLMIAVLESINGTLRELFVKPAIGDFAARRLGFAIAVLLILAVAWLTARWIGATTRKARLKVGALWMALMLAFEMSLGLAQGISWQRIAADYNPAEGGLMAFGMVILLLAPAIGARLARRQH